MIVLHILSLLLGTVIVLAILGSALKTVVLPQEGFPRLAQVVFALVYRLLVHRWRNEARAKALRALYAPVALVSLPAGLDAPHGASPSPSCSGARAASPSQKAFEISGSSLTTLGFSKPDGTGRIWLAFIEATIGLGLVALLISYLPTIFSAYNGREKGIIRLRPVAGSPPSATELLQTLHRIGALDNPDFWRNAGRLDARPGADAHRLPDPLLLPRDPHRPLLGRHRRARCSTPPRWSSRRRRPRRARSSRTSRRGP